MTVIPPVEGLRPATGLSSNRLVKGRPPVHATRHDPPAIGTNSQAQDVLSMALYPLGLSIGLAVPDAHLTSRVAGDNVAVR